MNKKHRTDARALDVLIQTHSFECVQPMGYGRTYSQVPKSHCVDVS